MTLKYSKITRSKNLFDPKSKEPFKLSRTKIEQYLKCPRCFYLDRRLGVAQPPGFPFSLNAAVDHLLKKEFDLYRAQGMAHPLMKKYGLKAIPLMHSDLDKWRENFTGVQYYHLPTNLIIYGAIDDVWVNPHDELIVVDYKATSKDEEVSLDADWQKSYKNQMEIYQWLLRQNGFTVAKTGYFVYVNGKRDRAAFDGKLEFDVKLIPYEGSDSWIEETLVNLWQCLKSAKIPDPAPDCEYCAYRQAACQIEHPCL